MERPEPPERRELQAQRGRLAPQALQELQELQARLEQQAPQELQELQARRGRCPRRCFPLILRLPRQERTDSR